MPHKHKRRQNDPNAFNLPPTLIAKPLPVRDASKPGKHNPKSQSQSQSKSQSQPQSQNAKQKQSNLASRRKSALDDDDTPRAFRRLMQFQSKPKPNPQENKTSDEEKDENNKKKKKNNNKKRKRDEPDSRSPSTATQHKPPTNQETSTATPTATAAAAAAAAEPALKILPGEKLSDFAARVDREMPISGMKRSNKPAAADMPQIRETKQTKHEKHLRRLQRQWREDDVKIREKEAAEREERETEMEEQLQLWKEWEVEAGKGKAKKKGSGVGAGKRKRKMAGGDGAEYDDGPDPWAQLKKKRAAVNPFDVAQAPPQLKKPREIFKVRGGAKVDVANVPAAVGSLRRREELANERRNIVEEYRRLMAEKRQ
ncbi:hypothetical protein P175DRAFT_0471474 [Aspergillus ochraceoroseus IBT 24754]|uniref:Urease accessory protein UreD n=2 Tax=Aspergillus ochraceoroseus TaxID=138278 RepID=A0A2T5M8N5_9EURO|nr:uncharacterized protein P175DRAFT_0471474 [Aspergillus ochraceoroseus IBT 24754]KKK23555.1 hypothetical protein AOCH_004142 [Aspergillus ochraceoroseus]PTU24885.1 hypothetical protein P175DRAFT_0471474 [Aspergillus ochraceoroseus IBT 24754]